MRLAGSFCVGVLSLTSLGLSHAHDGGGQQRGGHTGAGSHVGHTSVSVNPSLGADLALAPPDNSGDNSGRIITDGTTSSSSYANNGDNNGIGNGNGGINPLGGGPFGSPPGVGGRGGPERLYPETIQPSLSCPVEHGTPQGRACVHVTYAEQTNYCPDGFFYNADNGTCTIRKRRPARITCVEGSVLRAGRCEVLDVVPSIPTCDSGFVIEENVCVKLNAHQSKQICPEGYRATKNGCMNVSKLVAELKCPHNFELVGKRCESWVYEKPLRECPAGHVLVNDRDCVRELRQAPVLQCAKGLKSAQSEDVCFQETVLKPVHRCGQGEAKGKLCEFTLTQEAKFTCGPGFERAENRCVKIVETPLQPYCDQGFKLDAEKEVCIRTYTQKADVACPDGTLTKNGNCVVTTTIAADAVCAKNFVLDNGTCVQTSQTPSRERCPRGYKPSYRDECEMVVSIVPEVSCPGGHIARGGMCESTDVAPAVFICEDGTNPRPDGSCRKVDTRPVRPECPSGFQLSRQGDCTRIAFAPPVHYCDPEAQVVGDECEIETVIASLAECPKGFIGAEGRCQHTEILEAKLECPRKYKLKGGLCHKF